MLAARAHALLASLLVCWPTACLSSPSIIGRREVGETVMEWKDNEGRPLNAAKPSGCCEARISARLTSRLVPMRYAKLPFNSQFGMGGSNHPEANCSKIADEMRRHTGATSSRLHVAMRNEYKNCLISNPGMYYC